MNKPIQLAFLRNGELYSTKNDAIEGLRRTMTNYGQDGTMVLARYRDSDSTEVKTLFGLQYSSPDGHNKFITVFNSDCVITEDAKSSHNLHYEELYKESKNTVS